MVPYLLILVLQGLGIFFHVMQKVTSISKDNPKIKPKEVWNIFWQEDWPTVVTSGGILALNLVAHFIYFDYLHYKLREEWYYQISPFVLSLLGGYAGQRIIYKYFGSLETFVNKQADKIETV